VRDHAEINLDGNFGPPKGAPAGLRRFTVIIARPHDAKSNHGVLSSLDEKITLLQTQNLTLESWQTYFSGNGL